MAERRDRLDRRLAEIDGKLALAPVQEAVEAAQKLGANAVIGIDVDYEVLGADNGMLMVCVSGTAVKI